MATTAIERCIAFTQSESTSDIPRVVSKARKELRELVASGAAAEARGEVRALEASAWMIEGVYRDAHKKLIADARKRAGVRP